jgi:hypothetical protein
MHLFTKTPLPSLTIVHYKMLAHNKRIATLYVRRSEILLLLSVFPKLIRLHAVIDMRVEMTLRGRSKDGIAISRLIRLDSHQQEGRQQRHENRSTFQQSQSGKESSAFCPTKQTHTHTQEETKSQVSH